MALPGSPPGLSRLTDTDTPALTAERPKRFARHPYRHLVFAAPDRCTLTFFFTFQGTDLRLLQRSSVFR
jgi:hypothetical protein